MNDPYQVLGVPPSATDDEIKQAYRALAKKYHPDNYAGSPLADLASEKMSEINSAYDAIQDRRKNASAQGGFYGQPQSRPSGGSYGGYQGGGQFSDIRRLINAGRIFDAEQLLDGTPAASRDAEWNFLKGNVLLARGFLEDALTYLQKAVSMDPQNYEYRAAYERINAQRQFGHGGGYSYSACDPCSLCSTLICANCLCNTCCRCYCF
ncbi:J domain-containing protein [Oscillospiraceae bacterium LTW-04]|nr:DnaJ domain-containing protein [Oscillospiraceae bacterium MB24-C1]